MAVFGAGGIGLNMIQGGVLAGARRIIAVDLVPAKLDWAREFGATDVDRRARRRSGPGVKDLTARTRRRPRVRGGRASRRDPAGVQLARARAERSPSSACRSSTRAQTSSSMRSASTAPSWAAATAPPDPQHDFPMLADLYLRGRLKIDELITRRYALEDINRAIDELERGELARGVFDSIAQGWSDHGKVRIRGYRCRRARRRVRQLADRFRSAIKPTLAAFREKIKKHYGRLPHSGRWQARKGDRFDVRPGMNDPQAAARGHGPRGHRCHAHLSRRRRRGVGDARSRVLRSRSVRR